MGGVQNLDVIPPFDEAEFLSDWKSQLYLWWVSIGQAFLSFTLYFQVHSFWRGLTSGRKI